MLIFFNIFIQLITQNLFDLFQIVAIEGNVQGVEMVGVKFLSKLRRGWSKQGTYHTLAVRDIIARIKQLKKKYTSSKRYMLLFESEDSSEEEEKSSSTS